jgi:hypothetical protein
MLYYIGISYNAVKTMITERMRPEIVQEGNEALKQRFLVAVEGHLAVMKAAGTITDVEVEQKLGAAREIQGVRISTNPEDDAEQFAKAGVIGDRAV